MSRQPIHITLAGRELVVDAGTTAGDAICAAGRDRRRPRTVIAARVNGALRDLAAPLADGDQVEPVDIASEDGRAILRHSTAHVMAQAVQELFPEAKLGIGPPVENGFYYDFDVPQPFGPDDLKTIEARMRAIVKQGQRFSRRVVSDGRGPRRTGRGAVQAGADRPQGRPAGEERGGRGRRGRADHLRQPRPGHRRAVLEGPVPRAAPAHHPAHPGVQADAHAAARTGGAARRTRSCSGSTAPRGSRGRPRTTTCTCWPEAETARPPQARRRARPVLVPAGDRQRPGGVPPQGRRPSGGSWRTTRGSGTSRPATSS